VLKGFAKTNIRFTFALRFKNWLYKNHKKNSTNMSSGHNDTNYNSKGKCFGYFMLFFILFIMLLIYVYNSNGNGLDTSVK
jgi:hypothetical protein